MPKPADGDGGPLSFEASWEETRRRQLTLGLRATPAERLRWLEEMLLIAHRSGALERRRKHKRAHSSLEV
jgi:hypothetical protein